MRNIPILIKYLVSFAIVLALMVTTAAYAWMAIVDIKAVVGRTYEPALQLVDAGRTAQRNFLDLRRYYSLGNVLPRAEWQKGYVVRHDRVKTDLQAVLALSADKMVRARTQQAISAMAAWDALIMRGMTPQTTGRIDEAAGQVQAEIDAVVDSARSEASRGAEAVHEATETAGSIFLGLATVAVLISALIAVLMAFDILGPLRQAVDAARRIAAGDLDTSVVTDRLDEPGQLLVAIETMRVEIADSHTKLVESAAALEEAATTDPLTGLNNRRRLNAILEEQHSRTKRFNEPLSAMIIDVDKFKLVNDTYGHQVGDAVLVDVARILKTSVREVDIVGRWGGEEFVVICPNTEESGAIAVGEKLRAAIEAHAFPTVGQKTASFGVAQIIKGETIDAMIERADQALYQAKEGGRNQVRAAGRNAA